MTNIFTKAQIKECINYLNFCVKEGYIDENEANKLIKDKKWKEIYDLMDKGDYYANQKYAKE